jgi:K+-transporting ATPase KdpF subunit
VFETTGNKTMNYIYLASAIIAAALMLYLLVALVLPERFS